MYIRSISFKDTDRWLHIFHLWFQLMHSNMHSKHHLLKSTSTRPDSTTATWSNGVSHDPAAAHALRFPGVRKNSATEVCTEKMLSHPENIPKQTIFTFQSTAVIAVFVLLHCASGPATHVCLCMFCKPSWDQYNSKVHYLISAGDVFCRALQRRTHQVIFNKRGLLLQLSDVAEVGRVVWDFNHKFEVIGPVSISNLSVNTL